MAREAIPASSLELRNQLETTNPWINTTTYSTPVYTVPAGQPVEVPEEWAVMPRHQRAHGQVVARHRHRHQIFVAWFLHPGASYSAAPGRAPFHPIYGCEVRKVRAASGYIPRLRRERLVSGLAGDSWVINEHGLVALPSASWGAVTAPGAGGMRSRHRVLAFCM